MTTEPNSSLPSARGTVMAFDFGLKRIGVAVGELTHGIAHPLDTIEFADNARRLAAIERLVREWQPVHMIVGMPRRDDAEPHAMQAPIEAFMRNLRKRFRIEVTAIDESLSSWEASRSMSRAGVRARRQKHIIDTMAAREILQTWFEEQGAVHTSPPQEP